MSYRSNNNRTKPSIWNEKKAVNGYGDEIGPLPRRRESWRSDLRRSSPPEIFLMANIDLKPGFRFPALLSGFGVYIRRDATRCKPMKI